MTRPLIIPLETKSIPESAGSKASSLHMLARKKYRIPRSWVCTWETYDRYLSNDLEVLEQLEKQIKDTLDSDASYAVRSSANVEDHFEHSHAGQFKTVLNVRGIHPILQAIWAVWATARSTQSAEYRGRIETCEPVRMAVLIQEMVEPVYSGVAFSRNPITFFDEILVEAVAGSGSRLVQDGVTPIRWVNKWNSWIEEPEHADPVLEAIAADVVQHTQEIARKFDTDVDLEWVYDGKDLYWLQMRSITTGQGTRIYSNRISRGMIPGQVKPLVYSVNIPLTNGQWVALIEEIIKDTHINPEDLAESFYYQVYFDMGTFGDIFKSLGLPRESLEMMMGIIPPDGSKPSFKPSLQTVSLLPRILKFIYHKWTISPRFEKEYSHLLQETQRYRSMDFSGADPQELLGVYEKYKIPQKRITYFNIVIQLLMDLHNTILQRLMAGIDEDCNLTRDLETREEMRKFDPNFHLTSLHNAFRELPRSIREKILADGNTILQKTPEAEDFLLAFNEFLETFGHLSDSGVDFSYTSWSETPDILLELVSKHHSTWINNPDVTHFENLPVRGLKKLILRYFYQRTSNYRLQREKISSLYTLGVHIFRKIFLEMGDYLVKNGYLENREDIFYLYLHELQVFAASKQTGDGKSLKEKAAYRKKEMKDTAGLTLPELIYDAPPPLEIIKPRKKLCGTPASPGYYKGVVRHVRGLRDFSKLQKGEILAVPFTDVGWTPLFAHAGAIIAESGGLLSHSSIVAREYNIPAVVSVNGIDQLQDGDTITVDGYKGEISIHERGKA